MPTTESAAARTSPKVELNYPVKNQKLLDWVTEAECCANQTASSGVTEAMKNTIDCARRWSKPAL